MGTHRGTQAVSWASYGGHQCLMLGQVLVTVQAMIGSADEARLLNEARLMNTSEVSTSANRGKKRLLFMKYIVSSSLRSRYYRTEHSVKQLYGKS